jgi:hypothetical protein
MIKVRLHSHSEDLSMSGYTLEDESKLYEEQLQDIIVHTRWYLDNLEKLKSYRVRWHDYSHKTPVSPYRTTNKQKSL